MPKRVFVAINFPSAVLRFLGKTMEEIRPEAEGIAGIRFVSPANWHITLSFLGYQNDDEVARIAKTLEWTAENAGALEIIFDEIIYGPTDRPLCPPKFSGEKFGRARMIWLTITRETSRKIQGFKTSFESELEKAGIDFRKENRSFNGHVTMARMAAPVRLAELPAIGRPVNLKFVAEGLDLMESHLKRSGAEYGTLGKFRFGN